MPWYIVWQVASGLVPLHNGVDLHRCDDDRRNGLQCNGSFLPGREERHADDFFVVFAIVGGELGKDFEIFPLDVHHNGGTVILGRELANDFWVSHLEVWSTIVSLTSLDPRKT